MDKGLDDDVESVLKKTIDNFKVQNDSGCKHQGETGKFCTKCGEKLH
jgi:hypothetical protein